VKSGQVAPEPGFEPCRPGMKKPGIREGGRVFGVKVNYFEEAGAGAGAGAEALGQQDAARRDAAAAARAILVIFMWLVGCGCCLFGSPPGTWQTSGGEASSPPPDGKPRIRT
jgi:hypothetical protein